jgi:hypothetical protein
VRAQHARAEAVYRRDPGRLGSTKRRRTRVFISAAAFSVNVIARMLSTGT